MADAPNQLPCDLDPPGKESPSTLVGNAEAMELYLHKHIPLAAAIGVRVRAARPDETVLEAPLPPDRNHRSTAFGGSLSSLAMLAGWTVVHCILRARDIAGTIVIQRSRQHFSEPVTDAFLAACQGPTPAALAHFIESVERYGKGRLRLKVAIHSRDTLKGSFEGDYVVDATGA